jgi:hypothetical protein
MIRFAQTSCGCTNSPSIFFAFEGAMATLYLAVAGFVEAGQATGRRKPVSHLGVSIPFKSKVLRPPAGSKSNPNRRLGRLLSPHLQGRVMEQLSTAPVYVGVDISKDRLDVHVRPSGQVFAVSRDGAGVDQLVGRLRALAPFLVVLEATGGFEITVAAALAGAGLPLAVVNPRQMRDFARATGRLAKTDTLDAQIIALFAERVCPEPRPISDADSLILAELAARRRQIVEMIGMESNRQRQARSPGARQYRGDVEVPRGPALRPRR